jgi:hypothetical protein
MDTEHMPDNIVAFQSQPAPITPWPPALISFRFFLECQEVSLLPQIVEKLHKEEAPPPEGLSFKRGVLFITSQRDRHFKRAVRKFRSFLAAKTGWKSEQLDAWLVNPPERWAQSELADFRIQFDCWWIKQKEVTLARSRNNLKKGAQKNKERI